MTSNEVFRSKWTMNRIFLVIILALSIISLPLFILVIFDVGSNAMIIIFIVFLGLTLTSLFVYIIIDLVRILKKRESKTKV